MAVQLEELRGFLACAGLGSFYESFVEQGVEDANTLVDADEGDLKEICAQACLKAGHRAKLKEAVRLLSNGIWPHDVQGQRFGELREFLASADLGSFYETFVEQGVEHVNTLVDADEGDLKEICAQACLKAGHRAKLKAALRGLSSGAWPDVQGSAEVAAVAVPPEEKAAPVEGAAQVALCLQGSGKAGESDSPLPAPPAAPAGGAPAQGRWLGRMLPWSGSAAAPKRQGEAGRDFSLVSPGSSEASTVGPANDDAPRGWAEAGAPPPPQRQDTVFLSDEERQDILDDVKSGYELSKVLRRMRCEPGSRREQTITEFYHRTAGSSALKPEPTHRELLHVKNQGQTLPLHWYPGSRAENYDEARTYRTFLVLGETGVGKTTLLDAFVNHLAGINLKDTWRWKLVNENHMMKKDGAQSQTEDISCYYITDERPGLAERERCHIKVIDSPGFGDTGGLAVDQRIVEKFKKYFEEELEEIDYVLAVVKSTESRWTSRARYVYDNVQQLFGADAMGRFVLMCTFTDGGECLAASTIMPALRCFSEEYFTFNNSALYVPEARRNRSTEMFWNICMESVQQFLAWVQRENKPSLSLSQAKEVIQTRAYLKATVQTGKTLIQEGMVTLDQSVKVLQDIKDNEAKINANGVYSRRERVKKYRWEKRSDSKPIQFCSTCQVPCCNVCEWPMGYNESQCTYFNGGRDCPKCPGRCPKGRHMRWQDVDYQVEYWVDEVIVDEFKQSQLQKGRQGKTFAESLLQSKKVEMDKMARSLLQNMQVVKDSLARLQNIALKPKIFDDDTYFNELIKSEEENKQPGWEERLRKVEAMREENKALQQLHTSNNLESLFPQYQRTIADLLEGKGTKSTETSCALQ